ncbi:polysaccharide deacetylase family protein [Kutzneria kofuensis]|jgi:peptidoglycan/xylan/chitin deacetylase (PgdA/CDA1 family)|uniref:Peptidoglycan/xylan/chitin deacetylase (PgdA/CDA1 family) n=1 Tax=Kutzneria kofuensis TaxID=103725 RepID=A0A7W9KEJ3_9PSEU|nr:polysaccharide deacetylase family protein [Kutzneria kofuensis]MBB5891106.1 peptidoglycan/xylan/chitin deacetylase (PgdA/CDA1 family) [Kutzneria kofuensis]
MSQSVVNLTVHGIGPTSRPLEPDEDKTWVTVDQFERVLDAAVGRPDVRITFDDGNASDVEIALPRLVERGLKADFFVLAGLLGKPGRLDRSGVHELMRAGMRIGSHGWAHRDWRRLTDEQAREEIVHAGTVLADLTGNPVTEVAIPFGSYDRHVLRRLRHAGVKRVYTSDGGRAAAGSWLQARNSLHHDIGPGWAHEVLTGKPSLPLRARRTAARAVKRLRG